MNYVWDTLQHKIINIMINYKQRIYTESIDNMIEASETLGNNRIESVNKYIIIINNKHKL